jgi:hypothetical protein
MDKVNRALSGLLHLIVSLLDLILAAIAAIEVWLRGQLALLGVPAQIQNVLLIAAAVILILAGLLLFGGLFRVLIVALLVLLAVHLLMPVLHA